jgi:hypothetical protein
MAHSGSVFRRRFLITAALLLAAAFVSIPVVWYACYWTHSEVGPLHDQATWPTPIRTLHSEMATAGIDTHAFQVILIHGRGGSDLSKVACRMTDTPEIRKYLTHQLDLLPVRKSDSVALITSEASRLAPPDWWPRSPVKRQMYVSRRLREGEEGDLYVVAIDSAQGRIFVHYHFNF